MAETERLRELLEAIDSAHAGIVQARSFAGELKQAMRLPYYPLPLSHVSASHEAITSARAIVLKLIEEQADG